VQQLLITVPTFYSPQDEASFFAWLESIPGVSSVVGVGRRLEVTLQTSQLSDKALKDMLGLHRRYQLPMRNLATFLSPANESWFAAPEMYWHDAVFGAPS
jgi:hypothetical protein